MRHCIHAASQLFYINVDRRMSSRTNPPRARPPAARGQTAWHPRSDGAHPEPRVRAARSREQSPGRGRPRRPGVAREFREEPRAPRLCRDRAARRRRGAEAAHSSKASRPRRSHFRFPTHRLRFQNHHFPCLSRPLPPWIPKVRSRAAVRGAWGRDVRALFPIRASRPAFAWALPREGRPALEIQATLEIRAIREPRDRIPVKPGKCSAYRLARGLRSSTRPPTRAPRHARPSKPRAVSSSGSRLPPRVEDLEHARRFLESTGDFVFHAKPEEITP